MTSQENPDIFREKGLSRRPAATKALLRNSHGVLSRSCEVLVGVSLRFDCAFTALTMHALRFHDIRTALTAC